MHRVHVLLRPVPGEGAEPNGRAAPVDTLI